MKLYKKTITFVGGRAVEAANDVPGGLADGKTPESLATMHGVPVDFIESQIKHGIKVEMEHTNDESKAREIAMDHLVEIPDYYTRLEKMEEGH